MNKGNPRVFSYTKKDAPQIVGVHIQRFPQSGVKWIGGNSYVMVENPSGQFILQSFGRVDLVSVNGIGEVRWFVQPWHKEYEKIRKSWNIYSSVNGQD